MGVQSSKFKGSMFKVQGSKFKVRVIVCSPILGAGCVVVLCVLCAYVVQKVQGSRVQCYVVQLCVPRFSGQAV